MTNGNRFRARAVAALAIAAALGGKAFSQDVRQRDAGLVPVGGDSRLVHAANRPASYRLGINVQNGPAGVLVMAIAPGSLAQSVGIEPGDTIVCVSGYQVGYVGDRLFDLGDEIARRVDAAQAVNLLVRDGRTGVLENVPVRFAAASRAISGRIFSADNSRLPASAVTLVRVLDVSFPQWQDVVVAQGQLPAADFPKAYRLDLPVLQAGHRYAVDARVDHGGRVLMQTGQATPLAAVDRDQQVDLVLVSRQQPVAPQGSLQPRDQIDQWIRTYLGRPPRNFETEVWLAELTRGRTLTNVQAGILSSSELFERCGRSRDVYVAEVFRLLYGRPPNAAELANLQARYDQSLGVRLRFVEGVLQQPR
ncbi:MAG: YbaY family lipoprotein [Planctomycetota bacterium]